MTRDDAADAACQAILDKNFSMAVPWYLMAGWLYEVCGETLVSDMFWDRFYDEMTRRWDEIEHQHKHLIEYANDGEWGTGVSRSTAYLKEPGYLPLRVTGAARSLMNKVNTWYNDEANSGRVFVLVPPPRRRIRP